MIDRFAPDAAMPRQILVEARVASRRLPDPSTAVTAQLDALWGASGFDGQRIAIGVGSRGIDRITEVVAATAAAIRARGGSPIVVPAMGNHGGSTDEGQASILEGLGITEQSVGAPIRPLMTTRDVAKTAGGVPVHVAAEALDADGVVIVNRVKPHTDFESTRIGSGLLKMLAIGFGKSEGAAACHRGAQRLGLERVLLEVSQEVLARLPVVAGLALIEDGKHALARVEALAKAAIVDREPALLAEAAALMPALPFPRIDVLVVDRLGKDISGAGMDPNIIGRGVDGLPRPSRRSDVGAIYVRGLTPASHGNAIGMGMADVVSTKLVDSLDRDAMFTNALSSMTPTTAKTPVHFGSDRHCLRAALRFAGSDAASAGIVRIRSTIALDRFIASETYAEEIARRDDLEVLSTPADWPFDANGDFDETRDPLA